jgi:hypothetical protein
VYHGGNVIDSDVRAAVRDKDNTLWLEVQ